jgi:beta-fructofuranosidase
MTFLLEVEAAMRDFFYKPEGAWPGDFIPFYKNDTYHLFYLQDWRDKERHGEGTPWWQISTQDFVHFAEHGEMLPRGSVADQDLYVYTGSVVEGEGLYHIFYTGHNPHLRQQGQPVEAVMHAVSKDLLAWEKMPADTFFAPQDEYEPDDWRDPFVFWNSEAQEYWMLLAARRQGGPSRRRGCTALCASKDLKTWEVRPPFYAPGLYFTHECPDLFKMGDWWYLLFSEFSERSVTHYRMSRSLAGPWVAPDEDTFDNRALYAAKTASDGEHRYIFGWNPTRLGNTDNGLWQWGGNLVVHEVLQRTDGTLAVRVPASVDQVFGRPTPFELRAGCGSATIAADAVQVDAPGSFGCVTAGRMPQRCKITTLVQWSEGTKGCGVMLRTSADLEKAYYIRLEPARQRLVFDTWPRLGDISFAVELERPLRLAPGQLVQLEVFVDGTVCEVYCGGTVAMSTRLYDIAEGDWGVFVNEGVAQFTGLALRVPVE